MNLYIQAACAVRLLYTPRPTELLITVVKEADSRAPAHIRQHISSKTLLRDFGAEECEPLIYTNGIENYSMHARHSLLPRSGISVDWC